MNDEPWDIQRKRKYRDHDFILSDLNEFEIEKIRGAAVKNFAETREGDNLKLIINAFMGYLTSKGFRISRNQNALQEVENLIIKVAHAECDPRMSGPDGSGFGFCAIGHPEAPSGFGDTELEAAINFVKEFY